MRGNPGIIFETTEGKKVVAFNKEQDKKFADLGKFLCTHLNEDYTFEEIGGKPKKTLIHFDKLKTIGRWD